jgi:hypothetical protein
MKIRAMTVSHDDIIRLARGRQTNNISSPEWLSVVPLQPKGG